MDSQSDSRRRPVQARARTKVALLFEACLRILEREGQAALNTNRIAAVAGVSIGTLYQYFPDKEAIVFAMVCDEIRRSGVVLRQRVAALPATTRFGDGRRARVAVQVLIEAFGGRLKARRELLTFLKIRNAIGHFDEIIVDEVRCAVPGLLLPDAVLAVVVRSLIHTVDTAVQFDAELLLRPSFCRILATTAQGFMQDALGLSR